MTDKDIDKIPITVEVPKADVWVRNDYRDIVRRLGEVHMIRACEHQHDDEFVPLYDIETVAGFQVEVERLRAELAEAQRDAERYRWMRGDSCGDHSVRWAQWEVRCWKAPLWTDDLRSADLDAAIDAARGAE